MKKLLFFTAYVAVVLVFASCGNSKTSAPKEEEKSPYTKVTSVEGVPGYSIADYEESLAGVVSKGQVLLNAEKDEVMRSSTITYDKAGEYFIGTQSERTSLYFPKNKVGFYAMSDYVLADGIILIKSYVDEYAETFWGAYSTQKNDTILKPENKKLVLLQSSAKEYSFLIPYENGNWLKVEKSGKGIAEVTPAQARRLKGWQKDKEAFLIKQ